MRRLLAAGVLAAGLLLGGCGIPRASLHHGGAHAPTTTTGDVSCQALGCPGSPEE